MNEQTIVAVYDTPAHAAAAVKDLEALGLPQGSISTHAENATEKVPAKEPGFWASLFGGETDDSSTYSRSIESGSTVVTVKAPAEHVDRISQILDAHDPIDFDERAAQYKVTGDTTRSTASSSTLGASAGAASNRSAPVAQTGASDEKIALAEERLVVGKRAVNGGTTRVRRYTVETPVEQQVTLRDETIKVDRHAVAGGRTAEAGDFAEKTLELQEIDEEAVVGKQARVTEEISLRKEATDHTETVRDTVRKQEVEIEDDTARSATTDIRTKADRTP